MRRLAQAVGAFEERIRALIRAGLTLEQQQTEATLADSDARDHLELVIAQSSSNDIKLLDAQRQLARVFENEANAIQQAYQQQQAEFRRRKAQALVADVMPTPTKRYRRKPSYQPRPAGEMEEGQIEAQQLSVLQPPDTSLAMQPNQRVLARWDADGYYYPGRIGRTKTNGVVVQFSDGDEQECKMRNIVPVDFSLPVLKQGIVTKTSIT